LSASETHAAGVKIFRMLRCAKSPLRAWLACFEKDKFIRGSIATFIPAYAAAVKTGF